MEKTTEQEIEFQRQCEKLVQNEVMCCISGLAEECFNKEVFNIEDFENLFEEACPQCEDTNIYKAQEGEPNEDCFSCGNCNVILPNNELIGKDQEILEYWLVSEWLYKKLKIAGEPVYNYNDFNYIWGRTTSGQAISMDHCIRQIREDLNNDKF